MKHGQYDSACRSMIFSLGTHTDKKQISCLIVRVSFPQDSREKKPKHKHITMGLGSSSSVIPYGQITERTYTI